MISVMEQTSVPETSLAAVNSEVVSLRRRAVTLGSPAVNTWGNVL